jgi:hypothetical protein
MSAKLCLIVVTLAAGCARPPAIDGADCPCPGGYRCDTAKQVCVSNSPPGGQMVPDPTRPGSSMTPGAPMTAPPPVPVACTSGPSYFPRRLVRLSPVQLAHAIEDLTGYVVSPRELPGDVGDDLAITVAAAQYSTVPSPEAVVILADVARRAAMALSPPDSCSGTSLSAACTAYLQDLARRAYRRPLTDAETAELATIRGDDAILLGTDGAVRLAVEELIQSPQFIYRPELGDLSTSGNVNLTGDELASELAFVLTDRPPDDALLGAAARLTEPAMIVSQAARLSAMPASREKLLRFLESFADIERLADPPEGAPSLDLIADMRLETRTFLGQVLDKGGDLGELFGADYTFVTPALASYYGVTPPGPAPGPNMMSIPDRIGLLSQGSFLVAHAPGPSGLPSRRGVVNMKMLFGSEIPPPPPGLPPTVVPTTDAPARERSPMVIGEPACYACHALIDPLGLGLEQFDGAGHFRTTQGGKAIDTSISNYPEARGMNFTSTVDMARKMIVTPRGEDSFLNQYVQYVLGYDPGCAVTEASAAFLAGGARIPALLVALPASTTFTRRSNR